MKIQLDMYQTLAVAVLVLLLGNYLKKKIKIRLAMKKLEYSGACHRRTDFCHHDMHMLCHRNRRIFL